jgi:hypothetical protein
MSSRLAFGTESENALSPKNEDFPWESDISSDSDRDLTMDEKRFKPKKANERLEKIEKDRASFLSEIEKLRDEAYTSAMNVLHTSMYAVERIHDLGETLEKAKEAAGRLDEAEEGTPHLDKCYRWIRHYEDSKKLTAYIGLKTGLTHHGAFFKGPIEAYNSKRSVLKEQIDKHNDENEKYNEKHPHLHMNFKRAPFGYGEKDPAKRLTPEIPHLPPLKKALEGKIWKKYTKVYEMYKPKHKPLATIEELNDIFSQSSLRWIWNDQESGYKFDFSP